MIEATSSHDLYDANGAAFQVLVEDRELADEFRAALSDLRVSRPQSNAVRFDVVRRPGNPANPWQVLRDGELCVAAVSSDQVVPYVIAQICRLAFDMSDGRVALHGASASYDGQAVAIIGESEAGKSTLVTWLAHRGWQFLSDEVAVIDPIDLAVRPFWRPIGIRLPGPLRGLVGGPSEERGDLLVPASLIGALGLTAQLAMIVIPMVKEGTAASIRPLSGASSLVSLASSCPDLARLGVDAFERLARVARNTVTCSFEYGDLDDAERVLRAFLACRGPRADTPAPVQTRGPDAWVMIDDEVVVFQPHRPMLHHLNRSAGLIWKQLQIANPAEAAAALSELTGRPRAEIENDVQAALSEFRRAGLLPE